MNLPMVNLSLQENRKLYQPGEVLVGQYRCGPSAGEEIKAIELSVLWYTEGKGEEDLAVHFFERLEPDNGQRIPLHAPRQFSVELPKSPLTYLGVIVKIHWCVRLRVFLSRGKDMVVEESFQLGDVPPPCAASE